MAGDKPIIKTSERFEAQLRDVCREAGIEVQDVYDSLAGVLWSLVENPEVHPIVASTNVRLVKTRRRGTIPQLGIWYKVDEDLTVELLAIRTLDLYL